MKRILLILTFLLSFSALLACEFDYAIVDTWGKSVQVLPSQPVVINQGQSYTFEISFYEDHRNCVVAPSDTLFMLNGARWRPQRESQGLVLDAAVVWKENSARLNTGSTSFTALVPGTYTLEVMRVCDRGGYTAELIFVIPG